jgi:S1-C subfamily serine protease
MLFKQLKIYIISGLILLSFFVVTGCSSYNAAGISSHFSRSVVLICNMYYLKTQTDDGQVFYIGRDLTGADIRHDEDQQRLVPFITFGTGFFISNSGIIITNRHVAYPWDDKIKEIKELNRGNDVLRDLSYDPIFTGIIPNGSIVDISTSDNLVAVANKVAQTFYQCDIISSHKNPNVDLALLQMQARTLPPNTVFVRDESLANHSFDYKKGSEIFMIGYPGGLSFATTRKALYREIENTLSNGIISKTTDKYNIQYTLSTGSGSSGSPVFNQEGKVIAVNYAVSDIQGALINYGIKSGYISDLLDEWREFSLRRVIASVLVRLLLIFIPIALYNIFRIIKDEIIDLQMTIYSAAKLTGYVVVSLIVVLMNFFW